MSPTLLEFRHQDSQARSGWPQLALAIGLLLGLVFAAVLIRLSSLPFPEPGSESASVASVTALPRALVPGAGMGDRVAPSRVAPEMPSPAGSAQPPSEPVPAWVRTSEPAGLWSSPYPDAVLFTEVPGGTPLQVQGVEREDRVKVYYLGDGYLHQSGLGWVDSSVTVAALPPTVDDLPMLEETDERHLPHWVQVHHDTTLWSSPYEDAEAFTDLPQWSYLEVQDEARNGRLLAYYEGDYWSRQPGFGWVDEAVVGSSGYPGRWMRNHSPSVLWSGPDEHAERFGELAQWSWLRILDGAPDSPDRVRVYHFGDGQRGPGPAWVPLDDVGPVTPPTPLPQFPPEEGQESLAGLYASPKQAFIGEMAPGAQASQHSTGVPASVVIAQAILESNWGRSRLAREGKNLFGIKASQGPGSAGTVGFPTWEFLNGRDVIVQASFKAYASWEDSIRDHGGFLRRNQRYAGAFNFAHDPRAFAEAIHAAGYATDPAYSAKLVQLMDTYDLYQYDATD